MADGDEAYNIMRLLGVGITNKDFDKLESSKKEALKHKGKIFLKVESKGEAYYVNYDGVLYYLKNGTEAYNVMRQLGLGITNNDLSKIKINQPIGQSGSNSSIQKKASIESVNEEINKKIISLNGSIFDFGQMKNENIAFISSVGKDLAKYPDYYQYQASGKALVSEVTSENNLIDKLINLTNSVVAGLGLLLNTGSSSSSGIVSLESQMNDTVKGIKISQSASSELIKTNVKYLNEEMANDVNQKQSLINRMETECNQPIRAMKQEIIQIKSDYYDEVELLKGGSGLSGSIYNKIDILTDKANLEIDILNNQIDQKILDCSSLASQLDAMMK